MNYKSVTTLEFDKIKEQLSTYGVSEPAKEKLLQLMPLFSQEEVMQKLSETTQAVTLLKQIGTPPLPTMKNLVLFIDIALKGGMLMPEQLTEIVLFLSSCARMKRYLSRSESLQLSISGYGGALDPLTRLSEELQISIRNNEVDSNASSELKSIRRKIDLIKSQVKEKLESLLRSKKEWFTEGYVSMRNGHYVLPVRKEYKNQISGSVLDVSSTGSTYFIEPNSVSKMKEELSLWEIRETNEIYRILYTLTSLVLDCEAQIKLNMECMISLDFIFAKGKLSLDMNAVAPSINTDRNIHIANGRHPLLQKETCVPLSFALDASIQGIIITGPNTGGKTVALKTIGLFLYMAQSGLHIPCDEGNLCMISGIFCDIGDGQSITENLSTFSSHISNIINILKEVTPDSFVFLDELGSGTDPAEGMGIAIAILEELRQKKCLFVATTHYPEIKDYAKQTPGLLNARMAFDRETLKPLYNLEIGAAGDSCALYIAKRLGLPKRMLERAYYEAYGKRNEIEKSNLDSSFIMTMTDSQTKLTPASPSVVIKKAQPKKEVNTRSQKFQIGDSVVVYPQKKIGLVFRTTNEQGEIGVQIQKKKKFINHKRLQLKAPATELYPEDYDFSIVFDSVANRKARKAMGKGHRPDLNIVYDKE